MYLFGGDVGLMTLMRFLHELLLMLGQVGLVGTLRLLVLGARSIQPRQSCRQDGQALRCGPLGWRPSCCPWTWNGVQLPGRVNH